MKIKSYFLLFFLTLVLFFILGVRYGQRVEKTNKVIDYILSITPTKKIEPTKTLEFATYQNKTCGIKFLYPSLFEVKNTSTSAVFNQNNNTEVEISCDKENKIKDLYNDPKTATGEVIFKNKSLSIKTTNDSRTYLLKIFNQKLNDYLYVLVSKSFFPLFESSFTAQ